MKCLGTYPSRQFPPKSLYSPTFQKEAIAPFVEIFICLMITVSITLGKIESLTFESDLLYSPEILKQMGFNPNLIPNAFPTTYYCKKNGVKVAVRENGALNPWKTVLCYDMHNVEEDTLYNLLMRLIDQPQEMPIELPMP